MYRHRNRPAYTPAELAELYKTPHEHTKWEDHVHRVDRTIEIGKTIIPADHYTGTGIGEFTIADLSCGDAAIAEGLDSYIYGNMDFPFVSELILGDFAPGYEFQGPIEETVHEIPQVDLFICSETIEHLDDPDGVLECIRAVSSRLLLSTPNCSWVDQNPEHYHSWDNEAVEAMLLAAHWKIDHYETYYTGLGYHYQIFACH